MRRLAQFVIFCILCFSAVGQTESQQKPSLTEREHIAWIADVLHTAQTIKVGILTEHVMLYAGNLGYKVDPPYRGRHLAARAINLLLPVARHHQMSELWICCNPENWASRKTCERIGAELVEIIEVPSGTDLYERGDRANCRYRLRL